MTGVELGKIEKVTFGRGGYDDSMFGLTVHIKGSWWGVSDFKGGYPPSSVDGREKWTDLDAKDMVAMCQFVDKVLADAKKSNVADLRGVPVEVTLDHATLVSWRVLTEVL